MKIYSSKGYGLIEVMVTILIISVGILALLRFQNYLMYANAIANQRSTATQLAVSRIETLRDYSALTGANSYANIASGSSTFTGATTTYTTTWTVTSFNNPTYKNIDVTVSWTDRNNNAQSTTLSTIVARLDPSYSATIFAL